MVNGISVNGLGEVSLDSSANQNGAGIIGLVSQPNIHPGSISSTGRIRGNFCQVSQTPVGGILSPAIFSPPANQLVLGQASHFPVNNSLMIGDYVTPGNNIVSVHGFRQ